ncbi:MAG: hypothetical protein ABIR68_09320 [Ilumatobacteraceae bacterium]
MGVIAPLTVLAALSMTWAGSVASAAVQRPSTVPPADPTGTTVAADAAPATSTTVAASGEDTGLGPEVSTPQGAPSISTPQVQSAPIVAVPAGCPTPAATTAVFFGKVDKMDFRTAQFTVASVRAGTLDGFAVGDQVQVRYGDDVRFLDIGSSYIVGATPDPATGVLISKLREATPLFGGDAVAGADDSDVKCPTVEDPVMTLTSQATPIDTGLLTPLREAKGDLLLAVLRPLVIALAVLVGLVLIKQLIFATGRSLRSNTVTERTVVRVPSRRPRRTARHTSRRVTRSRRASPGTVAPATAPGELVHTSGGAGGSDEAGA